MELTDLMVGDWVFIKDYPIKASPQKVRPEHFVRSLVEFEPIPLTTEILEKNGFEYDPYYHNWIYDEFTINYGHLIDEEEGDYLFIWIADTSMKLTYVHELQHALRLCGLSELADNLKL